MPTGFTALDQHLPGGGWPLGTITEVLADRTGIGELQLVIPAMAALTQAERYAVWVAPPYIPYAPALRGAGVVLPQVVWVGGPNTPKENTARDSMTNYLWAAEQALRQPSCGIVLVWLMERGALKNRREQARHERLLRRLQIAAEVGGSWGVLFRPNEAASRPSPAAIRLSLVPRRDEGRGTEVHLLKCRGRAPTGSVMTL